MASEGFDRHGVISWEAQELTIDTTVQLTDMPASSVAEVQRQQMMVWRDATMIVPRVIRLSPNGMVYVCDHIGDRVLRTTSLQHVTSIFPITFVSAEADSVMAAGKDGKLERKTTMQRNESRLPLSIAAYAKSAATSLKLVFMKKADLLSFSSSVRRFSISVAAAVNEVKENADNISHAGDEEQQMLQRQRTKSLKGFFEEMDGIIDTESDEEEEEKEEEKTAEPSGGDPFSSGDERLGGVDDDDDPLGLNEKSDGDDGDDSPAATAPTGEQEAKKNKTEESPEPVDDPKAGLINPLGMAFHNDIFLTPDERYRKGMRHVPMNVALQSTGTEWCTGRDMQDFFDIAEMDRRRELERDQKLASKVLRRSKRRPEEHNMTDLWEQVRQMSPTMTTVVQVPQEAASPTGTDRASTAASQVMGLNRALSPPSVPTPAARSLSPAPSQSPARTSYAASPQSHQSYLSPSPPRNRSNVFPDSVCPRIYFDEAAATSIL